MQRSDHSSRFSCRTIRRTIHILSVAATILCGGVLLATPLRAADFTVTTTTDGGAGSLRAAITQANNSPGVDTIILPAGLYTLALSGAGEDANATGDLDITDSLIINGAGVDRTMIDGAQLDRVLHIHGAMTVQLTNLTIRNGQTTAAADGAGILNGGDLTLEQVILEHNVADNWGGGLEILSGATATLTDSIVRNNRALNGGGIDNDHGTLTLIRSRLYNNQAVGSQFGQGLGGGIGGAQCAHARCLTQRAAISLCLPQRLSHRLSAW